MTAATAPAAGHGKDRAAGAPKDERRRAEELTAHGDPAGRGAHNGAQALLATLVDGGVDTCFANPGTSEMHFVAALDRQPGMRGVLALFEGVVTGAADGYFRIAGRPAVTLLHLGPGLGNGFANLHNARKARSGIINVVGDHALTHRGLDSPLESDLAGVASAASDWVRDCGSPQQVSSDAAEAVAVAGRRGNGRIATLILPADCAWNEAGALARPVAVPAPAAPDADAVEQAARTLHRLAGRAVLLLGGTGVGERGLELAARIRAATGCRVLAEFYNARMACGRGRVAVDRIPYAIDAALATLADVEHLVLAGATPPVAFFAYPGRPSRVYPEGCGLSTLAAPRADVEAALEALAAALDATSSHSGAGSQGGAASRDAVPSGRCTPEGLAQVLRASLPENAILVDESISTGRHFNAVLRDAAPYDWLTIMGGAIGAGLPLAVGAAVAAPERKVVALEGDGSAMYTLQALWTMAREGLDVTVVVFANRAYQILKSELQGVGATVAGDKARAMLSLDAPATDWVSLARGLGVEAGRAEDLGQFAAELRRGIASAGPYLIEVVI